MYEENADMSKMQEEDPRRISILSQMQLQYRALREWWRTKHIKGEHPTMEAEHGRYEFRRNFDNFRRKIKDASDVKAKMGRVLRPASREEENARVQEKEERTRQRSLRISSTSKTEGWKEIEKLLDRYELMAYTNLRFPSVRKSNVSLDEWIGIQNGTLGIIEAIRTEVLSAVNSLKKKEE